MSITLYAVTGSALSTTSGSHGHASVVHAGGYCDTSPDWAGWSTFSIFTYDGSSETSRVTGLAHKHYTGVDNTYAEDTWTPGATIDLSGAGDKLRLKTIIVAEAYMDDGSPQTYTATRTDSYTDDTGGRGILQTTGVVIRNYLYGSGAGYDGQEVDSYTYQCIGNQTYIAPTFGGSGTQPTLTTRAITAITSNTAKSGGTVTVTGDQTITARGVCWNTGGTPTIADSHTHD